MTQDEFSRKFLSHLNDQQREGVQHVDGAILLLAVPGSGKTTVLVNRLGFMINCRGISPSTILTMTYTVAAANEMKQRFIDIFSNESADVLEFRTINGLSASIINYYVSNHSQNQPFLLLENNNDINRIVGQIYQSFNDEYANASIVNEIRTTISYIKNMMLSDKEIEGLDIGVPHLSEIYHHYCKALANSKRMDFDDQMIYARNILLKHPLVLKHFQDKYRYICVDEAQDTSKIQHEIIRLLANKYGNIFIVGDEDQSIYGFRGAYPDAILNFRDHYPNARILKIEQNYRSTNEIVAVANAFISKNQLRFKKTIVPTQGKGIPVQIIDAIDRIAQYKYLFAIAPIFEMRTAVLYRNNDSSLPLIDMFERNGLPYNIRQFDGGFFSHRIVTDFTDIIKFANNPHDVDIFMRIYYKIDTRITKTIASKACECSKRSGLPILVELAQSTELSSYSKERVLILLALLPRLPKTNCKEALRLIWEDLGYHQYVISKKLDDGKYLTLFLLGIHESSPSGLLRRLQELSDIIANHKNVSTCNLLLSTIHSSKGLEYDRVIMLDVFDGILPQKVVNNTLSAEESKHYEEDRRLFYVGITRAKKELYLFNCRNTESSFIREVLCVLEKDNIGSGFAASLLNKIFCGGSYVHKTDGKGIIAACNRDSALVEYADGKMQLLSTAQLIEQRSPIEIMESSQNQRPDNITQTHKIYKEIRALHEKKTFISKATTGATVTHQSYGRGVVIRNDGTDVTIRFASDVGVKRFDLKLVTQNNLLKIL
jgi:DNA helicase-2/ATP-dependent DNA helicase PcrA